MHNTEKTRAACVLSVQECMAPLPKVCMNSGAHGVVVREQNDRRTTESREFYRLYKSTNDFIVLGVQASKTAARRRQRAVF